MTDRLRNEIVVTLGAKNCSKMMPNAAFAAGVPSLELVRLPLMRRIPRPLPGNCNLWHCRHFGLINPDFKDAIAKETDFPATPKRPILSLQFRPAFLAGAAILERAENAVKLRFFDLSVL